MPAISWRPLLAVVLDQACAHHVGDGLRPIGIPLGAGHAVKLAEQVARHRNTESTERLLCHSVTLCMKGSTRKQACQQELQGRTRVGAAGIRWRIRPLRSASVLARSWVVRLRTTSSAPVRPPDQRARTPALRKQQRLPPYSDRTPRVRLGHELLISNTESCLCLTPFIAGGGPQGSALSFSAVVPGASRSSGRS